MGSCVSKPKPDGGIVKINPTSGSNHLNSEEKKRPPRSSLDLARKQLKQKKAVVDGRIQNMNLEDNQVGTKVEKKRTPVTSS